MSILRSIVYLSDAARELSTGDLESILLSAREQNRASGISGLLLHNGGNFMQCIEGPDAAVARTFARIKASRRHRNIIELMNEPVEDYSFKGWDMALLQPTDSKLLSLATARWKRAADDAPGAAAGDGWELLLDYWRSARR